MKEVFIEIINLWDLLLYIIASKGILKTYKIVETIALIKYYKHYAKKIIIRRIWKIDCATVIKMLLYLWVHTILTRWLTTLYNFRLRGDKRYTTHVKNVDNWMKIP